MIGARADYIRRTLSPTAGVGVLGPPPKPRTEYPGQIIHLLATDKLRLFGEMARRGDVTQFRIGPQLFALLMDPEDIRRVLVTEQKRFVKGRALSQTKVLLGEGVLLAEGEQHLRQRRLMQPAFHRERLAAYGTVMAGYTSQTCAGWSDGQVVDVHEEMMRLTLAIVGRTLFDVDVEKDAHDIADALHLSLRMFDYAILPFGPLLEYMPLPWVRRVRRSRARTNKLIYQITADRRANGTDRGDLLSVLIAARDAEGDGGGMTDLQLRDEIVTLLMAGHETTANALTWALYLLSKHPGVTARMEEEVDRVLGGRLPETSDYPQLTYTRNVLAEAMRLYPPAWIVERKAVTDFEAGGYTIRKGTLVFMSQYLVHRDPRWWQAPSLFAPDRWENEEKQSRPKFAYFPFGGGTRICVGEHFAWMEGTLVLATIAQKWRMRYEGGAAPVPEPSVTLRPKGGLPMRLVARPHASAA